MLGANIFVTLRLNLELTPSMLTEDLNIYHSMYGLLMMLMDARNQFDKQYKYIIGEKVVDQTLGCLTLIHYANEDKRKGARAQHLDQFLMEFDVLKTLIMVCRDRRQFKKDSVLAEVFIKVADVEKQASNWRRSAVS
jgi:hypothetical protein